MCTMDEHGRKLKSMCFAVFSSFVEQERKHTLILLEAMPTAEVQPNRISYNAATSSCEKAGEWQHQTIRRNPWKSGSDIITNGF